MHSEVRTYRTGGDEVVLDLTRNRSKIFCSPSCSNAAAVAAYRERQRRKPDYFSRARLMTTRWIWLVPS